MATKPKGDWPDTEHLRFDPENPRLPSGVDARDKAQALEWMLRDASIIALMGSIGEHGYFSGEPLLVVPEEDSSDVFVVIEGNRRLAAVMLLAHPHLATIRKKAVEAASSAAKQKPTRLPVTIFPRRDDILDYLGYRHVTGVKEWNPLAKARYLKQLAARPVGGRCPSLQELALGIGSGRRSDYVARLLTGLAIYERIEDKGFFDIAGLNETTLGFSVLTTALSYANISRFLGLDSSQDMTLRGIKTDRLKELTQWLFQKSEGVTRIGESRNLDKLSKILDPKNAPALAVFRRGAPLEEAERLTEVPLEVFRTAIMEARARLQVAVDHIHLVKGPGQTDADTLKEIKAMSNDLLTIVLSRMAEGSEA